MVERARERGDLTPGGMIIESTSGTLGLGLALAGIAYEHPVTLVTDPGLEPIMHRLHTAYGTRIQVVPEPHPTGGRQEARRRRVAALLDGHEGSYCPDQYQNPDNVAGYEPLALELVAPARPGRRPRLFRGYRRPLGRHRAGAADLLPAPAPRGRRHRRIHDLRSTGAAPAHARTRVEHPPAQRRPRSLRRGALGRAGRSGADRAAPRRRAVRQWWLERGCGRPRGELAGPHRGRRHPHRRGVSGRATAVLRHRLQRRVLPPARPARRAASAGTRRDPRDG